MQELRSGIGGAPAQTMRSLRIRLAGRVQAVGFRPFVYRLACRLGVAGSIRNTGAEVEILATGTESVMADFLDALLTQAPAIAQPHIVSCEPADPVNGLGFEIQDSAYAAAMPGHLPPDYFTCDACLAELHDPRDRRYRYPFINCTQCGPRYTLIAALPYDRARSSMAAFALCPACRAEYSDPRNRRFHAEPVACPDCGPQLAYRAGDDTIAGTAAALHAAVDALRRGEIVAVKGIGGYHLLCDARDARAVQRLRIRKHRPHKPLAVLFPQRGADGLDEVRRYCRVDPVAATALADPARPIVVLPRRHPPQRIPRLAAELAPGLDELGCLLPYSPLHHLLSGDFGAPLVATSANLSGEPVLTDELEAEQRLAAIADAFLHHDRPILRPADDSLVGTAAGALRRARLGRGAAPLELAVEKPFPEPTLAVGGHLKNTIALGWERRLVVSPHIGELDAPRSRSVFERVIADLQHIYGIDARYCAHDAHPGYASSAWAKRSGLRLLSVPHHHAHAAALAGEYPDESRWLVFTWDGTGMGEDGELWGGEALLGRPGHWQRVASFRPFALPGGDKAGRQPWRAAAALYWQTGGDWPGETSEHMLLHEAWNRGINCPRSSAAGRLFDAAASVLGLVQEASFEGQGPMYLEAIAARDAQPVALPWQQDEHGIWRCDWSPLLAMLENEAHTVAARAGCFHSSLAHALRGIAVKLRDQHGEFAVGLGGGVFQNRVLAEAAMHGLREAGLRAYLPSRIPCNDGGLSFGQLIEARTLLSQPEAPVP